MYYPLRVHSHYSILLSTLKSEDIIEAAKQYGYKAIGLTDFTTVSGCVEFYKAAKKKGIKPILGCELVVRFNNEDVSFSTLTLLCRNKEAWTSLLQIVSNTDLSGKYPIVSYDDLLKHNLDNFICIDGYEGSLLHRHIFTNFSSSYFCEDVNTLKSEFLNPEWVEAGTSYLKDLRKSFKHYYLETTTEECCSSTNPLPLFLSQCVQSLANTEENSIPVIVDNAVHYANAIGAHDHRVILCTYLKTTMSGLQHRIVNGGNFEQRLNRFLKSTYYKFNELPVTKHQEIYDLCEEYEILSQPKLPRFTCPDDKTEIEYLKDLCRVGWKNILRKSGVLISKEKENEYRDRVLYELDVIEKARLAGYFLIVQDYVTEFRRRGYLIGPARGSVCGCLIAYLIGITLIDPIPYDLLFSRFYDSSRIVEGKVSLPDIDVDFPPEIREMVIAYLKEKYGEENVSQIATYGRLQGKSALKEVLRVNEYCSFEQMNIITSILPSEGAISDQLEEMEDHSIILWALEHEAERLKDYCYFKDNELQGDYAKAFAQAMRLEGIHRNTSKHAAAVIISSERLDTYCPMIKTSRGDDRIIGWDMYAAEDSGGFKADILGLQVLSKIQSACED